MWARRSAVATFAGNTDVTSSSSTLQTFQITALAETITLGNLTEAYTGNQAAVTVTTAPVAGLAYTITYEGTGGTTYALTSTPPTEPGTYTVVATITAPNYAGMATGTLTIGPIAPPMILSLDGGSSNPSVYGTAVAFDLDVNNGAAPAPCPTGTVQFYVNGTASGSPVTLPTNCDSSLFYQIADLPEGADTIYAVYSGDANYPETASTIVGGPAASTTPDPLTQNVSADTTGVSLTSTATTINVGGAVTFTATITPVTPIDGTAAAPKGTVSFYECPSTATTCDNTNGTLMGSAVAVSSTAPYIAQLTISTLAQGSYVIGATYTPTSGDGEYAGSSATIDLTVTVTPIATELTWNTPDPIVYGTALSATQLDATATDPTTDPPATVPGTFLYTPGLNTVLDVGSTTLQVTFTPTDLTKYATQQASVTQFVTAATLTVTADNMSMPFGGPIPTFTYEITGYVNSDTSSVVSGVPTCTTTATVTSDVGTYPITCTLNTLKASNYTFTFIPGTLTVTAGTTLTIATLPTASNIVYGQVLASSILTGGTATFGGTAVPGTFAWTTPSTAPPAGTASYSVTFTATSSSDYNTATGMVSVIVAKADPSIATLPTAAPISAGQALSASALTGGTATFAGNNVPGTFAWTTPALTPGSGTDSESVTFTPTDATDYNTVTTIVSITVNNKSTPTITTLPTASALTYGQALSASTLTNGVASVAGTFAWTNPTTVPVAGADPESITFTPTDTTDYNTATGSVTVTVAKATPTVSTLPTASALSLGQTLAASTLTGGAATSGTTAVPGTFAWTTPSTAPPAGADPESVTFTPTDTNDYNTATANVTVTVNNKTTPTITTLPTASAIIYGQTLAASVLTGGAGSVAGTFAWTTPTTVPGAGTPSESVTFTPTDTTDYNTVTGTVTLTVSKATPTVSTLPTASAVSSGQTLASSTLTGGTATYNTTAVPGTFAWTTPTTVPPVGTDSESVTFTPTDTTDYNTVTTTVTVTVNNKTTPTITT